MNKHPKRLLCLLCFWILAEAILTGCIPYAKGHLFNSLTNKDSSTVWMYLFIYGINIFGIDFFQAIKPYIILKCSLWYRTARSKLIVKLDLNKDLDNIPQRIQEDIKLSYNQRITVWAEYIISGIILVQLMWINRSMPVLIGWALLYAVFSVGIAYLFNPRLTKAEIDIQQQEADFRASLIKNVRDISLLNSVNGYVLRATRMRTEYLLFTKLQLFMVAMLPYVIMIPKLLDNSISFGTMVEHQSTFGLIVVNAAILVQMYQQLIQGKASEKRVREIEDGNT